MHLFERENRCNFNLEFLKCAKSMVKAHCRNRAFTLLCTHFHRDPKQWGEVVWKWSLVCAFRRVNWWVQSASSLHDTNSELLSARSELQRVFFWCFVAQTEVLGWFVSYMRHKPPHAHTAVYHSVPTVWSLLKGSLLKYSAGSFPDALLSVCPFFPPCAFTSSFTLPDSLEVQFITWQAEFLRKFLNSDIIRVRHSTHDI